MLKVVWVGFNAYLRLAGTGCKSPIVEACQPLVAAAPAADAATLPRLSSSLHIAAPLEIVNSQKLGFRFHLSSVREPKEFRYISTLQVKYKA